ncbi:MAG: HAD hydrolase-like protein [Candidatus Shapirobacteria bacterium]|jgi:phosphoglycolate phosphatase-like HAD superfamily hydrolase
MEIVFDFDGTIADTFDAAVKILNRLAPEYGYEPVTEEMQKEFKRLGTKKAMKAFGVSWFQFIRVGRRAIKELKNDIATINMFPGMPGVFRELQKRGIPMGILSSNSKENILKFFNENGLEGVFEYIVPSGLMWGKARKLRKVIRKRKLTKDQLIYVGDETKDIIACHKVGGRIISVAWGYNSEEALMTYGPDWMAKKPQDIVSIVDGIVTE